MSGPEERLACRECGFSLRGTIGDERVLDAITAHMTDVHDSVTLPSSRPVHPSFPYAVVLNVVLLVAVLVAPVVLRGDLLTYFALVMVVPVLVLLLPAALVCAVWVAIAVARRRVGAVRTALVGIARTWTVVLVLCLLWELAHV